MLHPKRKDQPDPEKAAEPTHETSLYRVVTPLWDADSGRRLGYVRMDRLMNQKELATRLGIGHDVLSRIEQGRLRVSSFSLWEMRAVFNALEMDFILKGRGHLRYDESKIWKKYWDYTHKAQTANAIAARKEKYRKIWEKT